MIVWEERYAIGHPAIDKQHFQLFQTLNRLFELLDFGRTLPPELASQAESVLSYLHRYVSEHFRDEEQLMSSIGFPGLAWHREMHREFARDLDHLTSTYRSHRIPGHLLVDTVGLLTDWLLDHVLGEDLAIGDFLRRQAATDLNTAAWVESAAPAVSAGHLANRP